MPRERFVAPDTVRLPLSDEDFVVVKKRLNLGEHQDILDRIPSTITSSYGYGTRYAISRILEYLVSWSFVREGKPVEYSLDQSVETRLATLKNLSPDDFQELREAVDVHEAAIEKEVGERKNVTAGPPDSATT